MGSVRQMFKQTRFWAQAGMIAALYTVLSVALGPLSYGAVQLRLSEALWVFLVFTPAAVPGLFVGCLLSNIIGMFMGLTIPADIIFGSLTTLVAAWTGYLLRKNAALTPAPSVILNALIIGWEVHVFFTPEVPIYLCMLYVGIGQALSCYVVGEPLLFFLRKSKALNRFFSLEGTNTKQATNTK